MMPQVSQQSSSGVVVSYLVTNLLSFPDLGTEVSEDLPCTKKPKLEGET